MISEIAALPPLFVGPSVLLIGALLAIVLVLVIARVVIGLAWKLVVIGAVVLGVLWAVGAVGTGPPGLEEIAPELKRPEQPSTPVDK